MFLFQWSWFNPISWLMIAQRYTRRLFAFISNPVMNLFSYHSREQRSHFIGVEKSRRYSGDANNDTRGRTKLLPSLVAKGTEVVVTPTSLTTSPATEVSPITSVVSLEDILSGSENDFTKNPDSGNDEHNNDR